MQSTFEPVVTSRLLITSDWHFSWDLQMPRWFYKRHKARQ
jgi:hypothetical protein